MLPVHISKHFTYLPLLRMVTFKVSNYSICIHNNFIKISDSVGAVALPDGRVLICGGEMLEKKDGGVGKPFLY